MSELLSETGVKEAIRCIENVLDQDKFVDYLAIRNGPTVTFVSGFDYFHKTNGHIRDFLKWAKEQNSQRDDNTAKDAKVGELEAKLADLEASVVVDKAELESLRELTVRRQAEGLLQKEHVRYLQSKLHDARSGKMTRKIKNLESKLADAEKKIAELSGGDGEASRHAIEIDALKQKLAKAEGEREESWSGNFKLCFDLMKAEEDRDAAVHGEQVWKNILESGDSPYVHRTKLEESNALNAELQRECRKVEEERDKAKKDAEYWKTCWEALQKEHVRHVKDFDSEIGAIQSQRDRAARELSQCQSVIRSLKQSLEGVSC